jgi:hypothetical protein
MKNTEIFASYRSLLDGRDCTYIHYQKSFVELFNTSNVMPVNKSGRKIISAEKAFLLCVWYLSNQESFRQVADRFDVTLSSAHRQLNYSKTLQSHVIMLE